MREALDWLLPARPAPRSDLQPCLCLTGNAFLVRRSVLSRGATPALGGFLGGIGFRDEYPCPSKHTNGCQPGCLPQRRTHRCSSLKKLRHPGPPRGVCPAVCAPAALAASGSLSPGRGRFSDAGVPSAPSADLRSWRAHWIMKCE